MKKSKLIPHLTNEQLFDLYKTAADTNIKERWHFLWLVQAKNYLQKDAAAVLGHPPSWGAYWKKLYSHGGSTAVVASSQQAPKNVKLTEEIKAELYDLIKTDAPAEIGGGQWSGPKIAKYVLLKYNVKIGRLRGWYFLREADYTIQTVRPQHSKTSKEDREAFKKNFHKLSKK
jgi:transposase